MKFKTLKTDLSSSKIKQYFKKFGLEDIANKKNFKKRHVNQMRDNFAFQPELDELYLLHRYIILFKRMTVLEFGIGWSTIVMANAIQDNKKKYFKNTKSLRMNNPGEICCIDNSKSWIKLMRLKLKRYSKIVNLNYSEAYMDKFNGKICTSFKKIPKINPDFIYLDGPDQFNIKGKINGFNINQNDLMPMTSDILKIEHFLKPGTIIIVDGRASNSRFLKSNFQRKWKYSYNQKNDQHVFFLNEKPLGQLNKKQIKFYFND